MQITLQCTATTQDPVTHEENDFVENLPVEMTTEQAHTITDIETQINVDSELFDMFFPTLADVTAKIRELWPRYAASRIVRTGTLFRKMQLNLGTCDKYLQEDIDHNGFVPTTPQESPNYKEELFKEWTQWEDEYIQTMPLYQRLAHYQRRYRINITDTSEIEIHYRFPFVPFEDEA